MARKLREDERDTGVKCQTCKRGNIFLRVEQKSTRSGPIRCGPANPNDMVWFEVRCIFCNNCSMTFKGVPGHPDLAKQITDGLTAELRKQIAGKDNTVTQGAVDHIINRAVAQLSRLSPPPTASKESKPQDQRQRLEDPLVKWQRDAPRVHFK